MIAAGRLLANLLLLLAPVATTSLVPSAASMEMAPSALRR
jgi:hypothetical protein